MTDRTVPGRLVGRRRRENVAGGRRHRHEVWVSPQEEARLVVLAEAAGVTVPRLLVEAVLAERGETLTARRAAIAEMFAVRRLLAGVATNVNQLARHANAGEEFPAAVAGVLPVVRRVVRRLEEAIDGMAFR